MDTKSITEKIKDVFETHKNEEHIEVEIRLGKHNGSLFDTNVGKETFERVLKGLRKYDGWEETKIPVNRSWFKKLKLSKRTSSLNP
jgi:hypothetical protein